jgi:hypothetical protein
MGRRVTSSIQTWQQKQKNFLEIVFLPPPDYRIFFLYATPIHVRCGIRPTKPFGRPRLKSSKYAPHIDGSTSAKCNGWRRLYVSHSSDYQMRTASLARDHPWHRCSIYRMLYRSAAGSPLRSYAPYGGMMLCMHVQLAWQCFCDEFATLLGFPRSRVSVRKLVLSLTQWRVSLCDLDSLVI